MLAQHNLIAQMILKTNCDEIRMLYCCEFRYKELHDKALCLQKIIRAILIFHGVLPYVLENFEYREKMMLRHLWAFLKWLVIILLLLALCAYLFLTFAPTFGGQPDAQSQKRIVDSTHFNGEIFKNLIPTKMDT